MACCRLNALCREMLPLPSADVFRLHILEYKNLTLCVWFSVVCVAPRWYFCCFYLASVLKRRAVVWFVSTRAVSFLSLDKVSRWTCTFPRCLAFASIRSAVYQVCTLAFFKSLIECVNLGEIYVLFSIFVTWIFINESTITQGQTLHTLMSNVPQK